MIDLNALHKIAYFQNINHTVLGNISVYHLYLNDRVVVKALVQIAKRRCTCKYNA